MCDLTGCDLQIAVFLLLSLFWTKHHSTTKSPPPTTPPNNSTRPPLPSPPQTQPRKHRLARHSPTTPNNGPAIAADFPPPSPSSFTASNTPPVDAERRTRSAIIAERVEPRVRIAAFRGRKRIAGASRPLFLRPMGERGATLPRLQGVYVNSVWGNLRIKIGSRPLFARPMADQGGGVASPPRAFLSGYLHTRPSLGV